MDAICDEGIQAVTTPLTRVPTAVPRPTTHKWLAGARARYAGASDRRVSIMNGSGVRGSLLSRKAIPTRERLVVALDLPSHEDALDMVGVLGDSVEFYKIGLELFMAGNYFLLADKLIASGKKVMVDLKFFDIPETVGSAVRRLRDIGVSFATVHGNDSMLSAAVSEAAGGLGILSVTVLTSLDEADIRDLGFSCSIEDLVLSRARRSLELGCDGVLSSGMELRRLRETYGEGLMLVSPGIRPLVNRLEAGSEANR